jgi:hypothetical protein
MTIARPLGWFGVVGGLLAQVAAYTLAMMSGPEVAAIPWLGITGIAATMSGTLVIGALRQDRLSLHAAIAAAVLLLVPLAAFSAVLLLPQETASGPLLLGLPRRAAIVLFGIGVLPVFLLPVAYARDNSAASLSAESLAELRSEAARLRGAERVD